VEAGLRGARRHLAPAIADTAAQAFTRVNCDERRERLRGLVAEL
jgi:hypothetical protein